MKSGRRCARCRVRTADSALLRVLIKLHLCCWGAINVESIQHLEMKPGWDRNGVQHKEEEWLPSGPVSLIQDQTTITELVLGPFRLTINNRCSARLRWRVSQWYINKRRSPTPGYCTSDGGKAFFPPPPISACRGSGVPPQSREGVGEISARRICCGDLQKLIAHDRSHSSHMWGPMGSWPGMDFSCFVFNGGQWCSN